MLRRLGSRPQTLRESAPLVKALKSVVTSCVCHAKSLWELVSRRYGAQHRKDADDYKSTSFLKGYTLRECSVTVLPHAWAPSLVGRRHEDAAAEEVGVADAVRDRSRAHAVLASAAAKCDPPSAGWNSLNAAGLLLPPALLLLQQQEAPRSASKTG